MTSSRAALATALLLSATLLSACAASPAEPDPTPSGSPSATPTPDPAGAPHVRIDATCDDLVPADRIVELFGAPEPVSSSAVPATLYQASLVQEGVLECRWGSDSRAGVAVVPDAADGFPSPDALAGDDTVSVEFDAFGNASRHYCVGAWCVADVLVGSAWLYVWVWHEPDAAAARAWLEAATAHAVDVVSSSRILPRDWEPARSSPLTLEALDSPVYAATVAEAFGLTEPQPYGGDEFAAWSLWTRGNTGYSRLVWSEFADSSRRVGIETLPGGAWAAEALATRPGASPVDVPGAESGSIAEEAGRRTVCFVALGASLCVDSEGDAATLLAQTGAFVGMLQEEFATPG